MQRIITAVVRAAMYKMSVTVTVTLPYKQRSQASYVRHSPITISSFRTEFIFAQSAVGTTSEGSEVILKQYVESVSVTLKGPMGRDMRMGDKVILRPRMQSFGKGRKSWRPEFLREGGGRTGGRTEGGLVSLGISCVNISGG